MQKPISGIRNGYTASYINMRVICNGLLLWNRYRRHNGENRACGRGWSASGGVGNSDPKGADIGGSSVGHQGVHTGQIGQGTGRGKKAKNPQSGHPRHRHGCPRCGDGGWHPAWRGQYRLGRCGTCRGGRAHPRHFTRLRWE